MNPFMQPQQQKTVEQLMAEEKTKFRPWFIWFTVVLSITFLLALASLAVAIAFREDYFKEIRLAIGEKNKTLDAQTVAALAQKAMISLYIGTIVPLVLFGVMLIWYIANWTKCLQKKDYSFFNPGFFILCVILVFFFIISNWNLPQRITNLKSNDYSSIISIVTIIFYVLSYGFIGSKCNKIVKEFRYAKAYEQQRKLEEQLMKNPQSQNAPFFPFFMQGAPQNTQSQNPQSQPGAFNPNSEEAKQAQMTDEETEIFKENPEIINSKYYQKLKTLDRVKLDEVANKLNIFGTETLSDTKLRAKIASIYLSDDDKGVN